MISLFEKLKQSLITDSIFDDEEVMLDDVTTTVYNADILNINSLFRKSYKIQDKKSYDINDACAYVEKNSIFINHDQVVHLDDTPINKFYNNTTDLYVGGLLKCIGGSEVLSDKTIAKNIICTSLITQGKSLFKDLHILCTNDIKFKKGKINKNSIQNVSFQYSTNNKEFDNVFIKILSKSTRILYINSLSIPKFKNMRCNCDEIIITGPDIFKNAANELNRFFSFPFTCNVYEYGINKDIVIKNFNILKTLGSYKYKVDDDVFLKILKDSNLTDLIDISKCPYLKCLKITDCEYTLQFDNGDKKYNTKNILSMYKNVYTKDRWRVSIYK